MELTQDEVEYRPSTPAGAGRRRDGTSPLGAAARAATGATRMTVTQAIQTARPGHYRVKNVVRSEAVKILTLRSTAITLGITVVAALLVTGLVSHAALGHSRRVLCGIRPDPDQPDGHDRRRSDRRRLRRPHHHRRILQRHHPHPLAATPRRPILLAAKIGVTAAAVIVFCEILELRLLLPRASHPLRPRNTRHRLHCRAAKDPSAPAVSSSLTSESPTPAWARLGLSGLSG